MSSESKGDVKFTAAKLMELMREAQAMQHSAGMDALRAQLRLYFYHGSMQQNPHEQWREVSTNPYGYTVEYHGSDPEKRYWPETPRFWSRVRMRLAEGWELRHADRMYFGMSDSHPVFPPRSLAMRESGPSDAVDASPIHSQDE